MKRIKSNPRSGQVHQKPSADKDGARRAPDTTDEAEFIASIWARDVAILSTTLSKTLEGLHDRLRELDHRLSGDDLNADDVRYFSAALALACDESTRVLEVLPKVRAGARWMLLGPSIRDAEAWKEQASSEAEGFVRKVNKRLSGTDHNPA
jgi:hypothetical protein